MKRRHFINTIALSGLGATLPIPTFSGIENFTPLRPLPKDRKYKSEIIEKTIVDFKKACRDEELSWLFENCFPNTIDTTVFYKEVAGKPDTFLITGDIHAMWLRDSTAQVWPYLPFIDQDTALKKMVLGLIRRQTDCILIDPYANAFNDGPTGEGWQKDATAMKPELHERKWEIDSLCYTIRLAHGYWTKTNDASPFDERWLKGAESIVQTFKEQQRKNGPGPYKFGRSTSWSTDTVPGDGFGNPVKPVGLIASTFRPSDDATIFPFLIPSNFFAVHTLRQLASMLKKLYPNHSLILNCTALADEVEQCIREYAVVTHPQFGKVFAYEVDGFGNHLWMDDANVPSLLSLPYLGAVSATDSIYQNTRKLILSNHNPYFFKGTAAEGIGSPHTLIHSIWPISITMRGLTSNDANEIKQCLSWLKTTHGGKGFMHESFQKDNATKYTRDWFAWANTLFAEFLLKVKQERPECLR